MNVWFGQTQAPDFPQGAAVTIGNFDGVHLGHRHILQRLKEEAQSRGLPAVAIVFEPQPQEFFARKLGRELPYRLTPLRSKLQLLRDTGCLDAVWVLRFNQAFADIGAQAFISRLLRQSLNTQYLLIGDDFRFGAGREGDFAMLQNQRGMVVERTPSVMVENIRASSTAIRQALSDGRLDYAKKLLGHDYMLSGHVKHGAKLGRTIGCPTANVQLAQSMDGYSRETDGYKAYAVSYMLCKRYGVDAKEYEISKLDGVFEVQVPRADIPAALTDMRDAVKSLNGRMARAMGLTRDSKQKEQER